MKRALTTLVTLTLIAGPTGASALPAQNTPAQTALAANSDIAHVSAYIRAVRTLTADFSQTDRNGQTLTGKLTLKQPGRIRFQYQQGVPLLIVGDGKSLTMIDYEVRQVQRWPIGSSPLGALIDPDRDIGRFSKIIQTGDPRIVTVEARDPKRPEFGTITLVFNRNPAGPAGLELYGWVARDAQSNRTAVRLYNHAYGAAIPDSAFRWRDPRPMGRPPGK